MPETTPIRLLVCGGRDYPPGQAVAWLDRLLAECLDMHFGPSHAACLINGGATGADAGGRIWAEENDVPYKDTTFQADWTKYGKAAGPIRNQRMLDEGKPDFVIAFPGKKGTADMVRRAHLAGIPIWRAS